MSRKKSPFAAATSTDRPALTAQTFAAAAGEAIGLAGELLTEAAAVRQALATPTDDPDVYEVPRARLSKAATMRLRGLVELLAGEE